MSQTRTSSDLAHHEWQLRFTSMLPKIQRLARRAFRSCSAELRDELVAQVVADTFIWYRRLVERGREGDAHPTVLVAFSVKRVGGGLQVGSSRNKYDVSSRYCQLRSRVRVQSLHRFDGDSKEWRELLVACRRASPAECERRANRPAPSLENVWNVLSEFDPDRRLQVAVLAFTGMRVGELQRLLIKDVDFSGNWFHVVSRDGGETKTRESRKVPIHSVLRSLLADHATSGPWYFTVQPSRTYPSGGHWTSPKDLNKRFVAAVEALDLPAGRDALGFTLHSLRRFFRTTCVHAGISERVIDVWLGHRADKSMGAVYYDLSDEDSQRFMTKVSFETGTPSADDGNTEDEA